MPRIVDPGNITVGPGLAAEDSIEADALIHPTGGNDGLRVHILDPSRAHMASAIGIVDAGSHFVSDEVEGALQELASGIGSGFHNGLLQGGTFTSVGLTLTLDTPTLVLSEGTEHDISGDTVALIDNNVQYVYYNNSTNVLETSLVKPGLANERILIARVTTAGGVVTGSEDARFFVLNIDRKPPFTLRSSGTEANRNSEGAFESLTAAFLWLELYAGATGSDAIENHRILVRGTHTLSSTYNVPVRGVILEGDGDASFVTGAVLSPMFDTGSHDDVQFRNLAFGSTHATSECLVLRGSRCVVEKCRILGDWSYGIYQNTGNRAVIRDCYIEATEYGIYANFPDQIRIIDTFIEGPLMTASTVGIRLGSSALSTGVGQAVVRGCRIDGFDINTEVYGTDHTFTDCVFRDARLGAQVYQSTTKFSRTTFRNCNITLHSTTGESGIICNTPYSIIEDCQITNPRTVWAPSFVTPYGIQVTGGTAVQVKVKSNRLAGFWNTNNDTGYGIRLDSNSNAVVDCTANNSAYGISVGNNNEHNRISGCTVTNCIDGILSASGANNTRVTDCYVTTDTADGRHGFSLIGDDSQVTGCRAVNGRTVFAGGEPLIGIYIQGARTLVADCTLDNFLNTADFTGRGIYIAGTAHGCKVSGCSITTAQYGIQAATGLLGLSIANCTVSNVEQGIESSVQSTIIEGCHVNLDNARGLNGIALGTVNNCIISNCMVALNRGVWTGQTPVGINTGSANTNVAVTGCTVDGFYNATDNLGWPILADTDKVRIENCNVREGVQGVRVLDTSGATQALVSNTTVAEVETGIRVSVTKATVADCTIILDASRGVTGVEAPKLDAAVQGCTIINPRTVWGVSLTTPVGVSLTDSGARVTDNTIQGFYNPNGGGRGTAVGLGQNLVGTKVQDNWIEYAFRGIDVSSGCTDTTIQGNTIGGTEIMDRGITVSGTGAQPTVRTTIAGNTVRNCLGSGIRMTGNIRNATISDNEVDNYLASNPYNPTGLGIWCSAVAGEITQVTVTGNLVWRSSVGISFSGGLVTPVSHVTITGNTIHHCGFAQDLSGGVPDTFAGGGGYGVGMYFAGFVTISSNTIDRIGILIDDAGVESFPDLGAPTNDSQSRGVYLRNCVGVSVNSNTIRDCLSVNNGGGYGVYIEQQSSGIIAPSPFQAADFQVQGNLVSWAASGLPGNGYGNNAVRTFVSRGSDDPTVFHTLTNLMIDGNIVNNVEGIGVYVGAAEGATLTSVSVSKNQINNAGVSGNVGVAAIALNLEADGTTDPGNLYDVKVLGNTITGSGSHGILSRGERDGAVHRWAIDENIITNVQRTGILARTVTGATAVSYRDWSLSRNIITGFGYVGTSHGIGIDDGDVGALELNRFNIIGNLITTDTALTSDGSGIRGLCRDTGFQRLRIKENTIGHSDQADGVSFLNGYGIYVSTATSVNDRTDLRMVDISGNNVQTGDAEPPCQISVEGLLVNLTMQGNVFQAQGTANTVGILCNYTGALTAVDKICGAWAIAGNQFTATTSTNAGASISLLNGLKIRNVEVVDNLFANSTEHGLDFVVTDADDGTQNAVAGLSIGRNQFYNINKSGCRVVLGTESGVVDNDPMQDIAIRANRFIDCSLNNVVSVLNFRTRGATQQVSIEDNTFQGCLPAKNGADDSAIMVALGVMTGTAGRQININRNSMLECGGAAIVVEPVTNPSAVLDASMNGLSLPQATIVVGSTSEFPTAGTLYVESSTGISTVTYTGITPTSFTGCAGGSGTLSTGGNVLGFLFGVEDLSVCDNTIKDQTNTGILVGDVGASVWSQINIDRNKITNVSSTTANAARGVVMTWGDECHGVSISYNELRDIYGYGIYAHTVANDSGASPPTSGGDASNFRIDGNILYHAAYGGTSPNNAINLDVAGTCVNISASHNQVRNCGNTAASSWNDGTINLALGGSTRCLEVVGNSLRDNRAHGITKTLGNGMTTGKLIDARFHGNNIYNQSAGGIVIDAADVAAGFFSADDFFHNVQITGNTVYQFGEATGNRGIRVEAPTAQTARNLIIAGNDLSTPTEDDIRLIDIGFGCSVYNWLIADNRMERGTTGTIPAPTNHVGLYMNSSLNTESDNFWNVIIRNNEARQMTNYGFSFVTYRVVENFEVTGNQAFGCGVGFSWNLGTVLGSRGVGRQILWAFNQDRDSSSSLAIAGTNTPNTAGLITDGGWSCIYNSTTKGAGSATNGWSNYFDTNWNQTTGNLDDVDT